MKYLPFQEAREFVHGLRLKNRSDWKIYSKSGNKPEEIPSSPVRPYRKEWKGWGDWLGTGAIATFNRKFLDFETARAHVRALKLKSKAQWSEHSKSGRKPSRNTISPRKGIKQQWKGFGDWLGTGQLQRSIEDSLTSKQLGAQVRTLKLKGSEQWGRSSKSGRKSPEIPYRPDKDTRRVEGFGRLVRYGYNCKFNRKFLDFEQLGLMLELETKRQRPNGTVLQVRTHTT